MLVLPVLDLLDGVVVRGIAGRRDEYRPVTSVLAADARPISVARAFRDRLGLSEFYVADLDGIRDRRPALRIIEELAADDFRLRVDAGVRDVEEATRILEAGAEAVIAALETIAEPAALRRIVDACGPGRTVFSLDLKHGLPLGDTAGWGTREPLGIAAAAFDVGVRRFIVLDLAHVGMSGGVGTSSLCCALRSKYPRCEIVTGGGVGDLDDLLALRDAELDGALVASALHDGRIGRDEMLRASAPDA